MAFRLLVADDHEVVRAGIRGWLEGSSIEVAAEAASGREALQASVQCSWDLALVDVAMPAGGGFGVAEQLRNNFPNAPIVLYAEYEYPRFVSRASALGTAGLLLKGADRETMLDTLLKAAEFRPPRPRKHAVGLPDLATELHPMLCLTQRERQVIAELVKGPTNREIAQTLGISYETVKEHVQHILQKIGVADRTQAAVWAIRSMLVS